MDCTLRGESCKPCVTIVGDHATIRKNLAEISKEYELKTKMAICETERLRNATENKTFNNSQYSNLQLQQRLDHVKFLYDELSLQKNRAKDELNKLLKLQQSTETGIKSVATFLNVSNSCSLVRAGMNDEVNTELTREQNAAEDVLQDLNDIFKEIVAKVRKIRGAICCLEIDLEDKSEAMCIDNECLEGGMEVDEFHYPPYVSTSDEWQQQSEANIQGIAKLTSESENYRMAKVAAISKFRDSLNAAWECTTERLENIIQRNSRLLDKVRADSKEFAGYEDELSKEEEKRNCQIDELDLRYKLACKRLANRTQRFGMEKCDDNVEVGLIQEIEDLQNCLQILTDEHEHSIKLHRYWLQVRVENNTAEKNIEQDLKQDQFDCLPLRKMFALNL